MSPLKIIKGRTLRSFEAEYCSIAKVEWKYLGTDEGNINFFELIYEGQTIVNNIREFHIQPFIIGFVAGRLIEVLN